MPQSQVRENDDTLDTAAARSSRARVLLAIVRNEIFQVFDCVGAILTNIRNRRRANLTPAGTGKRLRSI